MGASKTPTVITGQTSGSTITIDATITRGHTKQVDITQHPVEQGVAISDHMRSKPAKLTMEMFVSDLDPAGADGNVESAYDFFKTLHETPELVNITTDLEDYVSMGMASITLPERVDLGMSLQMTSEWQFVLVVSTASTAATIKTGGKKQTGTKPPVTPANKPLVSAAKAAANKIKGEAAGSGVNPGANQSGG
jgi:Dit-like tail protein